MTSDPFRSFAVVAVLAITVAGAPPAPAWGADKPPLNPEVQAVETGIAKARALIRQSKFEEALAVLAPLVRGSTVQADALFQYGLAAIGASQQPDVSGERRDALLDEAIGVFHAMLVRRPELVRVQLELGRAFFLKGEDTLARRQFERVLAGKPPVAVALNVNRFLAVIRARKRWSVRVGMAVAPNSNVSARSDEETIVIDTPFGRLPLTYRGDRPRSGVGIFVWAGGEYQHPLDERWRLRAGADISRREYRSDEFDRMFVSAHLGPRWLIDPASEASVLASVRQSWLADEEDWRDLGVRVEGRHRLNRRTTAFLNTARHERRYKGREWLDGPLTDISAGAGWVVMPTLRVNAGLGWAWQRTELERQRNSSRSGRLGATLLLPYGFTVGGTGALRRTGYRGNWVPFVLDGGPRRDLTRTLRLDVHNRAVNVMGFSPRLSIVKEERTSNAQLHGYERVFGELSLVRLF